ncbi:MAG: hypothetical protein IJD47_05690 [Clostridia bacterium]|nr:hypothetical protein [Clostridia bacterium]MBQ3042671.1 hypothetical protein [Clostridia bacterium]
MKSKRKNSTIVGFFFVADYQWAIYLHHHREPNQFASTTMWVELLCKLYVIKVIDLPRQLYVGRFPLTSP